MISKEEIITRCKAVHGDKYDYSITESVQNVNCKIKYICPIHGIVEQTLYNHEQGKECRKCSYEKRAKKRTRTTEKFIEECVKKHPDIENYDFSKTDLSKKDELGRVIITCKKHGDFLVRPLQFKRGQGCLICRNYVKDDEEVKKELSKIHPNLDFSETEFSKHDEKYRISVFCEKHGYRLLSYYNLKNGCGCDLCRYDKIKEKQVLTMEEFMKRKDIFHKYDDYSYEKVDLLNKENGQKIIVTCKKHGDFKINVFNFLNRGCGCPICRESKLEKRIRTFLTDNKIKFTAQETFDWLGKQTVDFYLPEFKTAIECQGGQHFRAIEKFGGEENFNILKKRDERKKRLCEENGVKILYYSEERIKFPYKVFTNLEELKKALV